MNLDISERIAHRGESGMIGKPEPKQKNFRERNVDTYRRWQP